MKKLPDRILGHKVNTDFRHWMMVSKIMSAPLTEREKQFLCLKKVFGFLPPLHQTDRYLLGIQNFYLCGRLPISSGSSEKMLDWEKDANQIWSDFRMYANIDIEKESLHWWEFDAMFESLPPECGIKKVISCRAIDPSEYKDVKQRQAAERLKMAFSLEPIGDDY